MAASSITASRRRARPFSPARPLFAAAWCLFAILVPAAVSADVEHLLVRPQGPGGVVFEIVESDEDALQQLLPRVRQAIERVRARFPQTEFAVVSHGKEEFALQSRYRVEQAAIHEQVEALVADSVTVHVCETHAGWYGVSAEDFPDYVNVSPSGPDQIRLYEELGYELIVVY